MDETKKKPDKPDKPAKSRMNLWISDETTKRLDNLASERGVSASSITEIALRLYLERERVYREAESQRQAYLDELLTEIAAADVQAKLPFGDSSSEPKKEGIE